MRLLYIAIGLSLTACSPQQRLNRLIKKHPQLLTTTVDTLRIHDTITVEAVRVDTSILIKHFYERVLDTIHLTRERLTVKIWQRDSVIQMQGECAADTIFYDRVIPVERIVAEVDASIPLWVWGVIGWLLLMVLLILKFKT